MAISCVKVVLARMLSIGNPFEIQRIREVLNASEQIKYIDQEVLLDD